MEGLYAFETVSALRAHLTSDYDFIRYNGKLKNITARSFAKRTDQYKWVSLERKHKDNFLEYAICNLTADPTIWINDLNSVKAEKLYLEWKKWRESMTYKLKLDLVNFRKQDIEVINGNHPETLRQILGGIKPIFYLVALNFAFRFIEDWNAKINDPIIWPKVAKTLSLATIVFTAEEKEKLKLTVLDHCATI